MTKYRFRDIPAIPLLIILHLLFTLTSLILRLFESLHQPQPIRQNPLPPKHVAIVLASKLSVKGEERVREDVHVNGAVVETIRRCVEWAAEEGVAELSVWNKDGQSLRRDTGASADNDRTGATVRR